MVNSTRIPDGVSKHISFIGTPNPAYSQAIAMLAAAWLHFYHKIRGIPDESNIKAGFIFVASTVVLIFLTN